VILFLTAAMTLSLIRKCCPCNPPFIRLNRWKSGGAKSWLYAGCGRTVQPRLVVCSMIFKWVSGLVLLRCKRKIVFFSGLSLEAQDFRLVLWSVLMVCPGSRKSKRITPFLTQKTVHITLYTDGCILNLFLHEEFMSPPHGLLVWLWLIVVTPCLITSNDVIQETVTFSLILFQQVLRNLNVVSFYSWVSTHQIHLEQTALFQHWHHCFQHTEANIQFLLPGFDLLIHAEKLIDILFPLCSDN